MLPAPRFVPGEAGINIEFGSDVRTSDVDEGVAFSRPIR